MEVTTWDTGTRSQRPSNRWRQRIKLSYFRDIDLNIFSLSAGSRREAVGVERVSARRGPSPGRSVAAILRGIGDAKRPMIFVAVTSILNVILDLVFVAGLRSTCQIMLLPAISSVSLYVAAGLAVTLTNKGNLLANDPKIKFLPVEGMETMIQGLVWRRGSQNTMLTLLMERLKQ